MFGQLRHRKQHEETDDCFNWHCVIHGVDEGRFGEGGYLRCGECGHLYASAGALKRAYRRVLWSMIKDGGWRWVRTPFNPGLWDLVRGFLFRRVKDIYFCQFCIHDF